GGQVLLLVPRGDEDDDVGHTRHRATKPAAPISSGRSRGGCNGGQTGRIAGGGRAGGDRHRVTPRSAARVVAGAGPGAALRRPLRAQPAQGGEARHAGAVRRRRRDRARRLAGAHVLRHPRGPGHRRPPGRAAGEAAPRRVLRRDGSARPAAAFGHRDGRDRTRRPANRRRPVREAAAQRAVDRDRPARDAFGARPRPRAPDRLTQPAERESGRSGRRRTTARASAASGAATRNTARTASTMSSREPAPSAPGPPSPTCVPATAANTAPRTAAPTAPPRPRKKPVAAVATPSSRRSTPFWTAMTSTWVTMPKPSPKSARPMPVAARDVAGATAASTSSATVINESPATGKRL